jgi:DNA-binding MarR family transcriptional regulator
MLTARTVPRVSGLVDQEPASVHPSARELAVWRSFLRAHAQVLRTLETELAAADELPLASYDVLVQLTEAPLRRLRMTDLADRVLLSRSGLTRLVDRLERDGLVRREPCEDDARGLFAVVTDLGVDRLRRASRVHLAGVARHFVDRFSAEELAQLGALLTRLSI